MLDNLKTPCDKNQFSDILIKNKEYFFNVITDVEWYKILLKCHGFTNPYYRKKYDTVLRKRFDDVDIPQVIKDNFIEAKKQLRKK